MSVEQPGATTKRAQISREKPSTSENSNNHRPQNLWLMICARQMVLYY